MIEHLQRREALCLVGVAGAALAGAAVAFAPLTGSLALVGLTTIVLVVSLSRSNPAVLVSLALILQMASATEYGRESPAFAVGVRSISVLVCMVLLTQERQLRSAHAVTSVWLWGTLAFLWVGSASGVSGDWTFGILGLGLTVIALWSVSQYATPTSVGAGLDMSLITGYIICYLSFFADVSTPVEGGRLEGVFANANTLGFFAALGVARFATSQDRGQRAWVALLLAVPAVFWTGSRASAAALVIGLTVAAAYSMVQRRGSGRRVLACLLLVVAISGAWLTLSVEVDVPLLRTNDSRADGAEYAISVAESTGGLGHGYENGVVEIASTPLRWLADGGYPGLAFVVMAYIFVLWYSMRLGWQGVLIATFGVAHSTVEGWYFAGGSALFFAHWLAFFAAAPASRLRRSEADTPADSHLRRTLRPRI